MARPKKLPTFIGTPSGRSSGSPPSSSSTSILRPASRTSGRAAHALSSSSFNSYSCVRRSRLAQDVWSAAGSNKQHGAPLALILQSPAAVKDAFAVSPQDLRVTVRVRDVLRMRHHLWASGIRATNRVRLTKALCARRARPLATCRNRTSCHAKPFVLLAAIWRNLPGFTRDAGTFWPK